MTGALLVCWSFSIPLVCHEMDRLQVNARGFFINLRFVHIVWKELQESDYGFSYKSQWAFSTLYGRLRYSGCLLFIQKDTWGVQWTVCVLMVLKWFPLDRCFILSWPKRRVGSTLRSFGCAEKKKDFSIPSGNWLLLTLLGPEIVCCLSQLGFSSIFFSRAQHYMIFSGG